MWNLILNDDEAMIADSVRKFLTSELPLERLRPKAAPVDLVAKRKEMAALGWFGIGLPESAGGAGLGLVEEMLIQREFGRYLVSPSALAAVMAGHVALAAGDITLATLLADGQRRVALAMFSGGQDAGQSAAAAAHAYAFDWEDGDLLLAWTEQGMGLFDATAFSHALTDQCLDDSVSMHSGTLAPGRPLHWVKSEQAPLLLRARVLLAAALTGLAEHACELTVAYAKVRTQYGKPIGTFQAVKHRCADMGVRARLAWYQTNLACLKLQAGTEDALLQTASAALVAADAAHENGRASIQMHGGIGFQAECDVHWFMKRAHLYDQVGGGRSAHARCIVAQPAPIR